MTLSRALRGVALAVAVMLPSACALSAPEAEPEPEFSTRWDHRPEAEIWTAAKFDALATEARALIRTVPRDIDTFCPGYAEADSESRKAFWTALFSGLARYESHWRPEAAGAGGRYQGLLQISPATARHHRCDTSGPRGLYDGATNLRCAARIAAAAVARDGVVTGSSGDWGGVARDWPPMRNASKRGEIAAFTRSLPVCQG